MYDCQQDNYTGFTTPSYQQSNSASNLVGTLTALQADKQHSAKTLTQLLAWASERQIDASLNKGKLELQDVSLEQALQINRLFGEQLVISCHLRCLTPSHVE